MRHVKRELRQIFSSLRCLFSGHQWRRFGHSITMKQCPRCGRVEF